MRTDKYPLLSKINSPADLKQLKTSELPALCAELRDYIIVETAENPGHLGASLGTIELTVAIHYVFDTPSDKLVWDVGHQAYAHKILTGRKESFHTNRKYHGISGFPKMTESEYDAFGTGHSSTSISAVLGMAVAGRMDSQDQRNYIAVIGDGAIGGGMAFEAINHAAETNANILIILNDNKIAIDKNVGAMSRYLLKITASPGYNRMKNKIWNFFTTRRTSQSRLVRALSNLGNAIKGTILQGSNLFQSLGFRYFGPVDGHNVEHLVKVLQDLKTIRGARLLHAITLKGKGLSLAEKNQTVYHSPGKFDPDTGELVTPTGENQPPKYQEVFGETITELAEKDAHIVGITPAMMTGSSLTIMAKKFPERVFDVGIAEQHAVTFSAGLASQGAIPFCCVYSSFLQRAYDQIIHDVAIQQLPVIFCIDRAGIVGEDGATHHGLFDLAFLRPIPHIVIAAPMNISDLRNMLFTAWQYGKGPFAIRYPRGRGEMVDWRKPFSSIEIGKAKILVEGEKVAVLSLGAIGNQVSKAVSMAREEGYSATHVDMRFLSPLDLDVLSCISKKYDTIITAEDGMERGGLFSAVCEFCMKNNLSKPIIPIAVPPRFVEHGDVSSLQNELGFTPQAIKEVIIKAFIQ